MSLARFLADLFESGRVVVERTLAPEPHEVVDPILFSAESGVATHLAGAAPEFSLPSARRAARLLYGACQFLVCRDTDAKTIESLLREKCPAPHAPEMDYSVDLLFQYLPDVIGMTRVAASGTANPLSVTMTGNKTISANSMSAVTEIAIDNTDPAAP